MDPIAPPMNVGPTSLKSDARHVSPAVGSPHQYRTKHWVGSVSQGITPARVFNSLMLHATPFQRALSNEKDLVDIPMVGRVRQFIDPDNLTILNMTESGHLLHPGSVLRSVVQEGDNLYVVTEGYGTGRFAGANDFLSDPLWLLPDSQIGLDVSGFQRLAKHDALETGKYITDSLITPAEGSTAVAPLVNRDGPATPPSPNWPVSPPPLGPPTPLTLEQAYQEYRSRMNGANAGNPPLDLGAAQPPQATTAVPAAPAFTPPRNAAAWFAEMTGLDPNDPTRPAAMPDEDQLQAFVGRQPFAPWTLQRR